MKGFKTISCAACDATLGRIVFDTADVRAECANQAEEEREWLISHGRQCAGKASEKKNGGG